MPTEKAKLFFETSERSMRYLIDYLGHDDLAAIEISDAGQFLDYLFDGSPSIERYQKESRSIRDRTTKFPAATSAI